MAFSDMFRAFEAGRANRVSSGPFVSFRTLFDKYRNADKGAPDIAESRLGLTGGVPGRTDMNQYRIDVPEEKSNQTVSEMLLGAQSSAKTDTTFNDSVSRAIQNYNRSSRTDAKVRAALAASPNERIVRRS